MLRTLSMSYCYRMYYYQPSFYQTPCALVSTAVWVICALWLALVNLFANNSRCNNGFRYTVKSIKRWATKPGKHQPFRYSTQFVNIFRPVYLLPIMVLCDCDACRNDCKNLRSLTEIQIKHSQRSIVNMRLQTLCLKKLRLCGGKRKQHPENQNSRHHKGKGWFFVEGVSWVK